MLFGLFAPSPPLGPREKAWVEVRMRWLAEKVGLKRMTKARVILPTDEFFPDVYDETPEAARRILDRVGGYLGIDTGPIELQVLEDDDMPGAAGLFEPGLIRVAVSQLADPEALAATLAHELAHEFLYRNELLNGDELDYEWVTDLLPVYLGLGVFAANAALREKTERMGHHRWWYVGKQGYLPSRMIGYALALFAWAREELRSPWARHLRPDAAEVFRTGVRYLEATEDTLFNPEHAYLWSRTSSVRELIDQVEGRSESARIAALWELAKRGPEAGQAIEAIRDCLVHRWLEVRAEAARTLAVLGPAAEPALPELVDALEESSEDVRAAAAFALGHLRMQPEEVVPVLGARIEDESDEVVKAAAVALGAYGTAATSTLPVVLAAIQREVTTTGDLKMDYLVDTVRAISPDPDAVLQRLIASCDEETKPLAQALLPQCQPIPPSANAPGSWFGRAYTSERG